MKALNNKVCIFSSSRADFGLLSPVIKKFSEDKKINLKLLISGTHLKKNFGYTINEILNKKLNYYKINFPKSLSKNILKSVFLKKVNEYFEKINPKILIVLGDRIETFLVVISAYINHIPIVHISGGEVTIGSQDDSYRHAITKLSYLHFVNNKEYHDRVLQLGEEKKRIFISGSLAYENIINSNFLSRFELELNFNIKLMKKIILVTFHPKTLDKNYNGNDFQTVLDVLKDFKNIQFIFTSPNIDKGYEIIEKLIRQFVKSNKNNSIFIKSLGQINYFSLIKYSLCVIGNSSSGVTEVPLLNKPSINIGDRQKGRIMYPSIINISNSKKKLKEAISRILKNQDKITNNHLNFNLNPSNTILKETKKLLIQKNFNKTFYDFK